MGPIELGLYSKLGFTRKIWTRKIHLVCMVGLDNFETPVFRIWKFGSLVVSPLGLAEILITNTPTLNSN